MQRAIKGEWYASSLGYHKLATPGGSPVATPWWCRAWAERAGAVVFEAMAIEMPLIATACNDLGHSTEISRQVVTVRREYVSSSVLML
jgi:hypothetical protein